MTFRGWGKSAERKRSDLPFLSGVFRAVAWYGSLPVQGAPLGKIEWRVPTQPTSISRIPFRGEENLLGLGRVRLLKDPWIRLHFAEGRELDVLKGSPRCLRREPPQEASRSGRPIELLSGEAGGRFGLVRRRQPSSSTPVVLEQSRPRSQRGRSARVDSSQLVASQVGVSGARRKPHACWGRRSEPFHLELHWSKPSRTFRIGGARLSVRERMKLPTRAAHEWHARNLGCQLPGSFVPLLSGLGRRQLILLFPGIQDCVGPQRLAIRRTTAPTSSSQ